jgi:hypothetical protein
MHVGREVDGDLAAWASVPLEAPNSTSTVDFGENAAACP